MESESSTNQDNNFTKALQGLSTILEQAVNKSLKEEDKSCDKENKENNEINKITYKNMLEQLVESQKILCNLLENYKEDLENI